jgi:hypothetical protein
MVYPFWFNTSSPSAPDLRRTPTPNRAGFTQYFRIADRLALLRAGESGIL